MPPQHQQPDFSSCRQFALLLLLMMLSVSCSTPIGPKVSTSDYPFLAHTNSTLPIIWRKHRGPDFDVFYGQASHQKNSGFGFYRGGHPSFHPKDSAIQVPGPLGAFEVKWYRTINADSGRVYQTAVFAYLTHIRKTESPELDLSYTEKIHVWIYGNNVQEVESLAKYLGGLELFSKIPNDDIEAAGQRNP